MTTPTMFDAMVEDCREQLRKLEEQQKTTFESAWQWTASERIPKSRSGERLLVPFIGAGMNHLCKGGTNSWGDLVRKVFGLQKHKQKQPWSEHELKTSQLSYPEKLEIALRDGTVERKLGDGIKREFKAAFGTSPLPSDFHRALVERFPLIVTTNYEDTLQQAETSKRSQLDATNPNDTAAAAPDIEGKATLHLHGVWDNGDTDRIFRGVGSPLEEKPCLVLTESQYHRCYAHSRHFQRVVRRVFGPDYLLFFMGTGLSADEFGIHTYLRDLQLSAPTQQLVGIYTGFDLNPARRRLLESRGLACINLSSKYGQRRDVKEALWFALLQACSEEFGTAPISLPDKILEQKSPEKSPEIVCIGISSQHTVVARNNPPSEDSGNWVDADQMWDEVGGQHLVPALALAHAGRWVGLVSRLGDDDRGDWVIKEAQTLSPSNDTDKGNLDIQGVIRTSAPRETRRSLIVTYPQNNGGVRTNYDYEKADKGGWLGCEKLSRKDKIKLEKALKRYKGAEYLYVGPFETELSKRAIEGIRPTHVFVDTGTRGPGDDTRHNFLEFLKLEFLKDLKVTHLFVLASAKFLCKVTDTGLSNETSYDDNASGAAYQDFLAGLLKQEADGLSFLELCNDKLFGSKSPANRTLVVTLGNHGAAYIDQGKTALVPVDGSNQKGTPKAWIGCGDLFRAAFINEYLTSNSIKTSCEKGNEAGMDRVYRLKTLGHLESK